MMASKLFKFTLYYIDITVILILKIIRISLYLIERNSLNPATQDESLMACLMLTLQSQYIQLRLIRLFA